MIKNVAAFQDSSNTVHTSRLKALTAEKRIQIRAVIAKAMENKGFKINGSVSSEDMVSVCSDYASDLANVARSFDKMIKNERAKGASVNTPVTA